MPSLYDGREGLLTAYLKAQALRNLDAVFVAAGTSLSKAVKVTIFLASMDHLPEVNEAYAEVFTEDPKPVSTVPNACTLGTDR